jgi:hypothetical protein
MVLQFSHEGMTGRVTLTPVRTSRSLPGTAMLISYADETGDYRDPNSRCVGIGAIVASASKWDAFDAEWRRVCRAEGVELPFHMVDFANRRGQFRDAGWRDASRSERLMARLTGAVASTDGCPVGAIVPKADFNSLPPLLRERTRDDPYYFAFQCVTRELLMAAALMVFPPEPVSMVFARKAGYIGKAQECWHAIKAHDPLGSIVMGSHSVGEPRDHTPLQAADLWSYELGRLFHRPPAPPAVARWPLVQFVQQALQRQHGHRFFTLCHRAFMLDRLMLPGEREAELASTAPAQ